MNYKEVKDCNSCPSYKTCKSHDFELCERYVYTSELVQRKREGKEYRCWDTANVVYSKSLLGYEEIVYYPDGIYFPTEVGNVTSDHSRMFEPDEEFKGLRERRKVDYHVVFNNLRKCAKRAKNMIYSYGMANIWEWFITLTFAPKSEKNPNGINRYDVFEAKEKFQEFYRHCKRIYPDCKILAVWEYHKKRDEYGARALHFHVLASGLRFTIRPHYDRNGNWAVTKCGNALFELTEKDWPFGLTTLAIIPPTPTDNNRVVNYLVKYVTKFYKLDEDGNLCCHDETDTYGARRYFHSRNLDALEREVLKVGKVDLLQFVAENDFQVYKAKENIVVYRKVLV